MPNVLSRTRGSAPLSSGRHARRRRPARRPNARKGLDGVWEVQIQHPNGTDYTHFKLTQQGDALTGTYLDSRGKSIRWRGRSTAQASDSS